jgi:hypothetical protein
MSGQVTVQGHIDRLTAWIRGRGLATPALLLLETSKPLLPIGAQMVLLLQPLLGAFGPVLGWLGDDEALHEMASWLEDPAAVDQVLARLEEQAVDGDR